MENCIFCKIVKGELPSSKIYEDDEILAFLDIEPVNLGHALVIPKEHFVNIYETPEHILVDMMKVIKKLSGAIKNSLKADGINVTMNNDPAAGQIIFHSHIHIIPRLTDDGFGVWKGKTPYKGGEKDEIAAQITRAL
ncbi:MAG: HIT family protein [Patescibacteria group bacterium]